MSRSFVTRYEKILVEGRRAMCAHLRREERNPLAALGFTVVQITKCFSFQLAYIDFGQKYTICFVS